MDLKANIIQFSIRIAAYSLAISLLAFLFVNQGWVAVGIVPILSIQLFVIAVTMVIHVFLMRSAAAEIRIQQFMFNFLLSVTLKIVIYCVAFAALIYIRNNILVEIYSNLTLFLILFSFYLLYTVFEVASISKFVKKMS